MKKGIIIFMMGMFTLHLAAQTYNSGTWYSLYQTSDFELFTISNKEIKDIFAPTDGNMTFQYKYRIWMGVGAIAKVNSTHIYESANNGTDKTEKGKITSTSTSYQQTSISISNNINYIYFDRPTGNTNYVDISQLRIKLAQHILLAEGTYGTTAYTEPFDFGSVAWGATAAVVDEVALRSFLTNGNITISSSDAQIFRINSADNTEGVAYNVGANACASANGAAGQACADGVLGDINLYGFKIYFCPQEAKEYNGTITITDGTSTATVAVKGTGLKRDQTITFAPETPIFDTATIALATASSNLEPSYTFSPEGVVSFNGEKMLIATLSAPAQVTITASQNGNDYYNAATPVEQTITIYPSKTFGEDSAFVCPNDSVEYDGKYYQVGVYEDILLSVKNQYGSDSLVTFTVHALPTYLFEESKTMWVGKDSTWRAKDLSGYAIGEYILYDSLQTVAGCDSVYQLNLTVNALPIVYGKDSAFVCPNDSVEYHGIHYKVGEYEVTLTNWLGGDSIVTFTVNALPTYLFEESKTMWVGKDSTWRAKDLSGYAIGEYILYDSLQTVAGCDSVYQLNLTVNALPTVYGKDSAFVCPNDSVEYHGINYKVGEYNVTLTNWLGGDSIVTFTVNALPTYLFEEYKTMWVGKDSTWRKKDLSGYAIGEYILYDSLQTVAGCDSVYQLNLTVNALPTVYGKDSAFVCPNDSVEYHGIHYKVGEYNVTLTNWLGGDSIVTFTVNALPTYLFEESKTMWVGKDSTWRKKDLSGYAIGEYILYDSLQTVAGCDSVYQLTLTVTKAEQTITFELPTDTIKVEEILELSAEATSGLTVTYSFSADSLISVNENVLTAILPGELVITATQEGDDTYAAAEPVSRTLTIVTGTLTDIREVSDMQPKATKLMYKGQLFILRDNEYYHVQGSRVR